MHPASCYSFKKRLYRTVSEQGENATWRNASVAERNGATDDQLLKKIITNHLECIEKHGEIPIQNETTLEKSFSPHKNMYTAPFKSATCPFVIIISKLSDKQFNAASNDVLTKIRKLHNLMITKTPVTVWSSVISPHPIFKPLSVWMRYLFSSMTRDC